jgi:DNA repair protein RecN (Recombination protein N)
LLKGFVPAGNDEITQMIEKSESLYYEMEEMAYRISTLADLNDIEPDALEKADRRLELIHRLERKFGVDSDELPSVRMKLEERLSELNDIGSRTETMAAEHKKLLNDYRLQARALTESRKRLARIFERKIMQELNELGMGNTVFQVEFKQNDTGRPLMPSRQGDDHIEFLLSANPGEPLKPLSKVASGGELSRIMLALKTVESAQNGVSSMVFDEIDTGISGRMAQVVAEKMVSISRNKQVICVTHLPQIAAKGTSHYKVFKEETNNGTTSRMQLLTADERINEIAQMLSGSDISEAAINNAKELLRN